MGLRLDYSLEMQPTKGARCTAAAASAPLALAVPAVPAARGGGAAAARGGGAAFNGITKKWLKNRCTVPLNVCLECACDELYEFFRQRSTRYSFRWN